MNSKTFRLEPMGACNRKSLYGRAMVKDYGNGVYSLLSYGCEVAAGTMAAEGKPATLYRIFHGGFEFNKGGWSATTAEHLKSFAAFLGTSYKGKADWKGREYTTIAAVIAAATGKAA